MYFFLIFYEEWTITYISWPCFITKCQRLPSENVLQSVSSLKQIHMILTAERWANIHYKMFYCKAITFFELYFCYIFLFSILDSCYELRWMIIKDMWIFNFLLPSKKTNSTLLNFPLDFITNIFVSHLCVEQNINVISVTLCCNFESLF